MSYRRSARFRVVSRRPVVAFLLLTCFGLLFVGCKRPDEIAQQEEFIFTEQDVARFRELVEEAEDSSDESEESDNVTSSGLSLETESGAAMEADAALDLSMANTYKAVRTGTSNQGDLFRVTNEFLNIRSTPSVTAAAVARLNRGDMVEIIEFLDGSWAKVKVAATSQEGYASHRYLAKLTSEEKLAEEKKKYEGMYYVNFGFVNLRKEPNQQSEKLGEIPGQTILSPLSMDGTWAKVSYEGKDGYVSASYLAPVLPNFLVRQDRYTLPILRYDVSDPQATTSLVAHAQRLKQDGYVLGTFAGFRDLLLSQEQRDVRLQPNLILIAVTGVSAENVKTVSDALYAGGIKATLFVATKDLGLKGITEKMMKTLRANGFDIQSAGHTGDDLRALTNAQVTLELQQSRALLEEYTQADVFAVAYPQGGTNDRVTQFATEAGYLLGLSHAPERSFTREQFLRLPSFEVFPTMTADEVSKLVKGS